MRRGEFSEVERRDQWQAPNGGLEGQALYLPRHLNSSNAAICCLCSSPLLGLLSQELYEYLDASIMVSTSPEEAYRKYDDLTNRHIDTLRYSPTHTTLHTEHIHPSPY